MRTNLADYGLTISDFIELCDNSDTALQARKECGMSYNTFKRLAETYYCYKWGK